MDFEFLSFLVELETTFGGTTFHYEGSQAHGEVKMNTSKLV